ncbi:MAG: copper-binding protein [Burkholderiales bacterium]|nr:copper-binding protein [Burkholderiales bacterium]
MPAMTMVFQVQDPAFLDAVQVGNKGIGISITRARVLRVRSCGSTVGFRRQQADPGTLRKNFERTLAAGTSGSRVESAGVAGRLGYQERRCSNSSAGAGFSAGSGGESRLASAASHSGGLRASAIRCSAIGSPRWAMRSRSVAASVT